jgi:glucuronate isomerase
VSFDLARRLTAELEAIELIDPHSHINPHSAASKTLADIMGYHYYTELAHSAGLAKSQIEDPKLSPKEKVGQLVPSLAKLNNTTQVGWLVELCQKLFGFTDNEITIDNWEGLYDRSAALMAEADWEEHVLQKSNLKKVFLTNDFDDPLTGFDTDRYVPCLRTDDLVFHLSQEAVRDRLAKASGIAIEDELSIVSAIGKLFDHFCQRGAKACAISLPPDFSPEAVSAAAAGNAFDSVLQGKDNPQARRTISQFVFWTLAEQCAAHRLPFDLMIGVNRKVYQQGVYQGQDLFDSRVSLIQYQRLFNAFPEVVFPVSVLSQTAHHELVSYAWIFPNVLINGHWWYSNLPSYIEANCRVQLEGVPRSKQIGYYSDMYKLEFALPKFSMYRRILGKVLGENFVIGKGWSEERAVGLGHQLLRGNIETVFAVH